MSSTAALASTDMTSPGMIPADLPSARAPNGVPAAGTADPAAASPRGGDDTAAQGDHAGSADKDHLTFWDLLDVVNPLQHIPVVNTIYRELTGDTIKAPAKMAGALLYGGVIGLVAAVGDVVLEQETGEDFGTHVLDTLGLHSHATDVADTGGKVGTVTASNVDGGTLLPDDTPPPLPAAPVGKVEREALPTPTAATAGRLPRVIPNLAAVAAVDVQTGKNGPVPAGNAADDAASAAVGPDAARAAAPIGVARSFGHQYHPALANPGTGALPPGATPGGGALAGMPTGMSAGMIPGMGGGMGGGAGAAPSPAGNTPVLSPAMLKGNPLAQGLAKEQQQRPAGSMTPMPDAPFTSHAATSLARYRDHPVMVSPGEGTLPVQAQYQQTANRLHNDAPVPAATAAPPSAPASGPAPAPAPTPAPPSATPVATARGISAYRAAGRVTEPSSAYTASGIAVPMNTATPRPPASAPAPQAAATQAPAAPSGASSAAPSVAPSATMPTASAVPPAPLAQPPVDMRNFSEVMMANLAKYQQMQNQGPGAIH